MRISVFGLGYVGCVTAACLAANDHSVIGVDVNPHKVQLIETDKSPIREPGLEELLGKAISRGLLCATMDARMAVHETDISLICVGTPSNHNGCVNLEFVERVCSEIGESLRDKRSYHVVVVRSTVPPGTVQSRLIPILEKCSGRSAGVDYGVCMNPEFLREGSAIRDYYNPGFTVIGELDLRSGDTVECLYRDIDAQLFRTSIPVAEMTKYVSNTFHALKTAFSNEIGTLCKNLGVDGQQVMEIFCQDQRLNISPAYLRPGFAFGGSCLPKDVRGLAYCAKERDIETPVINAILPSNQRQIERAIELVERTLCNRVGILGLSFKAATDDVRESPTIALVETLVGRGYQVAVFDEIVDPEKLIGVNRAFLERALPHIASLMRHSMEEVVNESEVVVISNGTPGFHRVPGLMREGQVLIDLVGIAKGCNCNGAIYEGICW
ncbi:MAG: nucleotide sugar dehydrogenase [Anaerolineales bacterium]|nr:nucleotide sugar dehydrogenase [Anaerolineales bacterium]